MTGPTILLLREDGEVRQLWRDGLLRGGVSSIEARASSALRDLPTSPPAILVCDDCLRDESLSFGVLRQVRELYPRMPIILVATGSSEERAIRALCAAANDYIAPSSQVEELVAAVARLLNRSDPAQDRSVHQFAGTHDNPDCHMVGESAAMQAIKSLLGRVAAANSNVLITGETGTGKDLAAQFIHCASPRRSKPMVCINCAAIPDSLIESELFGYERGAFTGAVCKTAGQLERANGGTVFLDEVGEMSPFAQAKILRVIEGKEINRLGARTAIHLNVRFVAATNQNLEKLIAENRFRQDLFFRLNIIAVHLPSLRDHKEDLPVLFHHYIAEMNRRFGRSVEGLTESAFHDLLEYSWPGNIRELRNLLEAIFVNLPPQEITHIDLPAEFCHKMSEHGGPAASERDLLLSTLLCTKWNKSKAAKQLNWSRMTLYRKIAKYRLVA